MHIKSKSNWNHLVGPVKVLLESDILCYCLIINYQCDMLYTNNFLGKGFKDKIKDILLRRSSKPFLSLNYLVYCLLL